MARNEGNAAVSLAPEDFGSGQWEGGRATITNPRYEYRTITPNDKTKPSFDIIEAKIDFIDVQNVKHTISYDAFYGDSAVIREDADRNAPEAEVGYAVSAKEKGGSLQLRGNAGFALLLDSLVQQGFPSSKLKDGDIRVIADVEVETVQKKRSKDDKYPPLVVTEIYSNTDSGSSRRARGGKDTDADERPARGRSSRSADEDDDKPSARSSRGGKSAKSEPTAEEKAIEFVVEQAKDAGDDGATMADLIRKGNKEFKEDSDRKEILEFLGDEEWYLDQKAFTYKKRTKTVVV